MTETAEKKKVIVNFDDDFSVRNVIQKTVKALKQARLEKEANEFQREVVSGKPVMDVVRTYVIIA